MARWVSLTLALTRWAGLGGTATDRRGGPSFLSRGCRRRAELPAGTQINRWEDRGGGDGTKPAPVGGSIDPLCLIHRGSSVRYWISVLKSDCILKTTANTALRTRMPATTSIPGTFDAHACRQRSPSRWLGRLRFSVISRYPQKTSKKPAADVYSTYYA